MKRLLSPLLLILLSLSVSAPAADKKPARKSKPKTDGKPALDENAMAGAMGRQWADWVEPDFPFFSSVLDAREAGEGFPKDNLTPRGLILNLGHNLWACFDPDLLRIACIWQGEEGKPPITMNGLATGSYQIAGQKTKDGQEDIPTPVGTVWLANGIYPGWQVLKAPDDKPSFTDPRAPGPDKAEVGRGALDENLGRFKAIAMPKTEAARTPGMLGYTIDDCLITEFARSVGINKPDAPLVISRTINIEPHKHLLAHVVCKTNKQSLVDRILLSTDEGSGVEIKEVPEGYICVFAKPSSTAQRLTLHVTKGLDKYVASEKTSPKTDKSDIPHWPQAVSTKATLSQKEDAYVVDDIPLPLDNPWKRNVRLADLAFLNDQGDAAAVTMDGDVWLISGLKGDLQEVKWKRFASGLHEPMSIVARKDEGGRMKDEKASSGSSFIPHPPSFSLFVFDKNGIWKLRDTNHDGECDVYEMFCNTFSQTAETREFPNSMKLAPDGSLVISKGGQQGTTLGKHNGSVLRISPDGRKVDVIGYGLRQPYVGVHPKTGLITAGDQEGNYVPTTPLHIIRDHKFYGHLAAIQPHEQYPETITEPLTWVPHSIIASALTQVWLTDARMGPINDQLIFVSYNKPELFRVLMNNRQATPQATVVPWIRNLDFPTLNAVVNPADGQLYAVGFQIWGTTVKRISGLGRIRYTGKPRVLLQECTPCDKGVLLRFNLALDKPAATNPDNYNVERWNYKRTFNYGSPHLKSDGTPGQEWMVPSSAYLSKDGKSVFIGLPDMKTTYMQMRVGYGLKGAEGLPAENNAYFTPHELTKFDPEKEGFEALSVDLTPRKLVAAAHAKPTLDEGKRLYEMMGCVACHSVDGTLYGKVGPSWKGLYGSERVLAKGGDKAMADEIYLRESIENPPVKVVKGFEKMDAGMPVYAGVLNASQIDSLILFIKSLK